MLIPQHLQNSKELDEWAVTGNVYTGAQMKSYLKSCAIAHRSKSWFSVWCCSGNFSCVGRSADVVELLMHRLLAVYNVSYRAIGLANIIDHFIISPVLRSTVRKIGQLIWAICFFSCCFVCVTLLLGFCLSAYICLVSVVSTLCL
jgi:hypothetical protein